MPTSSPAPARTAEDCAGVTTREIKALFDSFKVLKDDPKRKLRSHIFLSKAVVVPCEVIKCRDADHLTNYLYDRRMMDADKLAKAIAEARKSRESIPLLEYTFTVRTQTFH